MRSRKRRARFRIGSEIVWLALGVNLAAGALLSPLTAVQRVRVEGVPSFDQARVTEILNSWRGVAAMRWPPQVVESRVQSGSEVHRATFQRNVFGRGVLKVDYRYPVAEIEGTHGLLLDANGQVYRPGNLVLNPDEVESWAKVAAQAKPGNRIGPNSEEDIDRGMVAAAERLAELRPLPSVRIDRSLLRPSFGLADTWPGADLVAVVRRTQDMAALAGTVVSLEPSGILCLNTPQGARIVLGGTERLDEKFAVIESILVRNPRELEALKEITLVEPSRPMAIPRQGP